MMARIGRGHVEIGFYVVVNRWGMSIRTEGFRPGSITTDERIFGPFQASAEIPAAQWAEIEETKLHAMTG